MPNVGYIKVGIERFFDSSGGFSISVPRSEMSDENGKLEQAGDSFNNRFEEFLRFGRLLRFTDRFHSRTAVIIRRVCLLFRVGK